MVDRTYCVVPSTAPHGTTRALKRWCADNEIELVKEERREDRRSSAARRSDDSRPSGRRVERRKVVNTHGRRVGERRATLVPVEGPALPSRRLRSRADSFQVMAALATPPEHLEDLDTARLAIRIQSGEKQLFEQIYERYFDRVYGYTRAFAPYAPEEALQDAFLDLHDGIASWDPSEQSFRTWMCSSMYRWLHGHALAAERLEHARPQAASEARASTERSVPEWVTDADLLVLMSRLPLVEREVMMLRYLWALGTSQIAAVIDEPAATVAELHVAAVASLDARLMGLAPRREAPSVRLAMIRRARSGRVLQSRRLALMPG